ncbi:hypothetical protein O7606_20270 [Micromonospora sp. WMMD882]|uniref:sensor histidine kinase n=1 Tax=Micromonospora sp. WMMD882 TaxID=3015151 RepID=UPI00248B37CA|nr:ATP-binding protein [Micromonospora sp. WMMD882]WBB78540.1 hypothetical protein O7606_20270 [Micromonospora sp. WMMD882]
MEVRPDAPAGEPTATGLRARLLRLSVGPAAVVAVIALGTAAWAVTLTPGPVPVTAALMIVCAVVACSAVVAGAAVRGRELARSVAGTPAATARESVAPMVGQQEVYVGLARRLQGLAHREIQLLDTLEAQVEDPDLLKGLFQVDHLATRTRRYAENLAVVGGAVPRRQWSRPLPLVEVLRSATAEVEQYARVRVTPPVEGTVRGHAGADVVHLLAELIENATVFAPPDTEVTVRARRVAAGVAVEVDDRGLGMPHPEQDRLNTLLADPGRVDVGDLLRDGRIGAWVVSALARRHAITVKLQTNVYDPGGGDPANAAARRPYDPGTASRRPGPNTATHRADHAATTDDRCPAVTGRPAPPPTHAPGESDTDHTDARHLPQLPHRPGRARRRVAARAAAPDPAGTHGGPVTAAPPRGGEPAPRRPRPDADGRLPARR